MDNIPRSKPRSIRYANKYYWAVTITLFIAFSVIMLGAYTRLSDAGLGCPDWPGCYGKLVLPKQKTQLAQVQKAFPNSPLIAKKAWTEMSHRYLASILGLLILAVSIWSFVRRRFWIPTMLLGAVAFQIMLGMWTVTMKVMPIIVVAHLMGGMTIAGLLCWLQQAAKPRFISHNNSNLKPWVLFGFFLLLLQIFLGAWTSTNYAALACPTFPFCQGSFFPTLHLTQAFNFFSPIGPNYEGGALAMDTRVTIQMAHRYGAFINMCFWLPFSLFLITSKTYRQLKRWGWLLCTLIVIQVFLGIMNVIKLLPMPIAVGHNGVAALFLIVVVALLYQITRQPTEF